MFPRDSTPRKELRTENWRSVRRLLSLEWALFSLDRSERGLRGERMPRFGYHKVLRRALQIMIRYRERQLRRRGINPDKVIQVAPKQALPIPAIADELVAPEYSTDPMRRTPDDYFEGVGPDFFDAVGRNVDFRSP